MPKKTGEVTLADFKKESKLYDKKEKVVFEDGSYTYIYKKFSPKKVTECALEFAKYIAEIQKHGQLTDLDILVFFDFHVFKHFSSLKSVIPDDIEKKNEVIEFLTKGEMFKTVMDAFPEEEKTKVWIELFEKNKKVQTMIAKNEEMRINLLEQIENMDLEHKDFIKQTLLTAPETMGLPFAEKLDIEGDE